MTTETVARALATDELIDIITIGHRSGQPRRVEIWFRNIEGRLYICGTVQRNAKGALVERAWLRNLRANPVMTFCLKDSVQKELAAEALEVTDPDHRRAVYTAPETVWYRERSQDEEDLIRHAPLVEVHLQTIT